jgi:hypothetical protein
VIWRIVTSGSTCITPVDAGKFYAVKFIQWPWTMEPRTSKR